MPLSIRLEIKPDCSADGIPRDVTQITPSTPVPLFRAALVAKAKHLPISPLRPDYLLSQEARGRFQHELLFWGNVGDGSLDLSSRYRSLHERPLWIGKPFAQRRWDLELPSRLLIHPSLPGRDFIGPAKELIHHVDCRPGTGRVDDRRIRNFRTLQLRPLCAVMRSVQTRIERHSALSRTSAGIADRGFGGAAWPTERRQHGGRPPGRSRFFGNPQRGYFTDVGKSACHPVRHVSASQLKALNQVSERFGSQPKREDLSCICLF